MSILLTPFQLLELNVISAQDLAPVARSMRTYAVAWVHPDRKLSTRVDPNGRANPTWNDKFVFRVDDEFLLSDTSAVMIEIYALHWFKDIHVGTVRFLVGNLIPPPSRPNHHHHQQVHMGMRFVALQVRRPSGRPQGILNVGAALLDSSMRSMPLYTHLASSAVGYRTLMGSDDTHHHNQVDHLGNQPYLITAKPELRRTKSETSSMVSDFLVPPKGQKKHKKSSSMINGSDLETVPRKKGGSKASSVINVTELVKKIEKEISSNGSDSEYPPNKKPSLYTPAKVTFETPLKKVKNENQGPEFNGFDIGSPYKQIPSIPVLDFAAPGKTTYTGGPLLTESELGPSPSEVAAKVAREQLYRRMEDGESSALGGWSLGGSSVEGLQSKLERWRAELPPVYDRSELSSFRTPIDGGSGGKHKRRHTDGGGLFSCFSNICGLECSIVCGSGSSRGIHRTPSMD